MGGHRPREWRVRIGKGEIATSSLTQKNGRPWRVTAAAAAPAAFIRVDQARKDLGLPAGIPVGEVCGSFPARRRGAIVSSSGMPEGCVPLDQAAIVEVGSGRADAADQSNMHGIDCRLSPVRHGKRRGAALQPAARTSRKRDQAALRLVPQHEGARKRKLCPQRQPADHCAVPGGGRAARAAAGSRECGC